jgi:hypothetical protein
MLAAIVLVGLANLRFRAPSSEFCSIAASPIDIKFISMYNLMSIVQFSGRINAVDLHEGPARRGPA